MDEIKTMRSRSFRRRGGNGTLIQLRESRKSLIEDVKQPLDDLGGGCALRCVSSIGALQEGPTEGTCEPVGLATSGQLVDGNAAIFLPRAGGSDGIGTCGIGF